MNMVRKGFQLRTIRSKRAGIYISPAASKFKCYSGAKSPRSPSDYGRFALKREIGGTRGRHGED
jgi:hypothetical protein